MGFLFTIQRWTLFSFRIVGSEEWVMLYLGWLGAKGHAGAAEVAGKCSSAGNAPNERNVSLTSFLRN